ncbi:MAG: hypothetical protein AB7O62_26185 [Pirellulales bacterium]
MNVLRCAMLLAVIFSPALFWPAPACAGPLGLFPWNKSEGADEGASRSVYARGTSSGETPYRSVAGSKKPNVFQRMGRGTRNFFGSTKNALTFKKKAPPSPVSGKTTSWSSKKSKPKSTSTSWFGSWFKPKEPEKPMDIKEWLKQDRLDY